MIRILEGDVIDRLRTLPDQSVHEIVTSPPYLNQRDYGEEGQIGLEKSPEEYVQKMVEVFREIRRVLRDDGIVWLNEGDSYFADSPMRVGAFEQFDPDKQTVLKRSAGGTRRSVASVGGFKLKDLMMIPARVAIALQADGWYLRSQIPWLKRNSMPESITDRPSSAVEYIFILTKSGSPLFWIHRDGRGTRTRPQPDYRYLDLLENIEYEEKPQEFNSKDKVPCPKCGGAGELSQGWFEYVDTCPVCEGKRNVRRWARINLWTGDDYFYDADAIKMKAENWGTRNRESYRMGSEDPFLKQTGMKDANFGETGRNRRNSDWFFESWQGLYVEDQHPLAMIVNPQPYPGMHFACVDDQTECLTISGWKKHTELHVGELIAAYDILTKTCSWVPLNNIAEYHVNNQEMVKVYGRGIDQLLTPNHRCIVQKKYNKEWIIEAQNLKTYQKVVVASNWEPGGEAFPVKLSRLIGWYVTEGHEGKECITLYQSGDANPEYCDEIRQLLKDEGAEYIEARRERIYRERTVLAVSWRVTGAVANTLITLCPKKRLPYGFLNWDLPVLHALWDSLMKGDGHFREGGRQTFVQKDAILISQVQALATRLGYSTTLRKRSEGTYALYKTTSKTRRLRSENNKLISKIIYSGIVWCPQTRYGTFVARRNGRVFITGNTFPYKLVEPCIKAGTSEKGCCPKCGAPWVRMVERGDPVEEWKRASGADSDGGYNGHSWKHEKMIHGKTGHFHEKEKKQDLTGNPTYKGFNQRYTEKQQNASDVKRRILAGMVEKKTVAWQPTCECGIEETVPCVVLDPFMGSGRTLQVARDLQRDAIGIDLSHKYVLMAREGLRLNEQLPV